MSVKDLHSLFAPLHSRLDEASRTVYAVPIVAGAFHSISVELINTINMIQCAHDREVIEGRSAVARACNVMARALGSPEIDFSMPRWKGTGSLHYQQSGYIGDLDQSAVYNVQVKKRELRGLHWLGDPRLADLQGAGFSIECDHLVMRMKRAFWEVEARIGLACDTFKGSAVCGYDELACTEFSAAQLGVTYELVDEWLLMAFPFLAQPTESPTAERVQEVLATARWDEKPDIADDDSERAFQSYHLEVGFKRERVRVVVSRYLPVSSDQPELSMGASCREFTTFESMPPVVQHAVLEQLSRSIEEENVERAKREAQQAAQGEQEKSDD
jgi:hypothetical protein